MRINPIFSMRYNLTFCFLLVCLTGFTQPETPKQLRETAKASLQKGDYDKALQLLDRARLVEPNNLEILKDLSFTNYLKRDFAKAIEIGKEITVRADADQQSFQMLGLSYKAIAAYKECAKLYKLALQKFPKSGLIYNEYAELLAAENDLGGAIAQWEKGIEVDPGYSSNYYNATMYYVRYKSWLRALLYGELFLNLESYSTRTEEIKNQLPPIYTNILSPGMIDQLQNARTATDFDKAILASLTKAASGEKNEIIIERIISLRKRFIKDWAQEKQARYPFQLFDNQQYLLSQGLFDAYNYWVFSTMITQDAYNAWVNSHPKESEAFKTLQQNKVFKIPAGQYYFSR